VTPQRRAPGLYSFPVTANAGEGARTITVTPLFDGVAVASARTYPIGLDGWRANYGALPEGGCAAVPSPATGNPFQGLLPLGALAVLALLRRNRQPRQPLTARR
jgi:MYXO-CTERM domain-containing protein